MRLALRERVVVLYERIGRVHLQPSDTLSKLRLLLRGGAVNSGLVLAEGLPEARELRAEVLGGVRLCSDPLALARQAGAVGLSGVAQVADVLLEALIGEAGRGAQNVRRGVAARETATSRRRALHGAKRLIHRVLVAGRDLEGRSRRLRSGLAVGARGIQVPIKGVLAALDHMPVAVAELAQVRLRLAVLVRQGATGGTIAVLKGGERVLAGAGRVDAKIALRHRRAVRQRIGAKVQPGLNGELIVARSALVSPAGDRVEERHG
ncbi:hypothetical protein [Methylobacterium sp. SyP6R]|uniref:hypothetical protein n=1 Tax=Methylobacterium sp. SyP6R TaxID=2718876 RepID=UPI001F34F6D5|nr:hypothetical protein [Methylobacterium sp. SyP6R]MCF4123842.1 hypothetical protein [Methylobacterium sp. SyP6R]